MKVKRINKKFHILFILGVLFISGCVSVSPDRNIVQDVKPDDTPKIIKMHIDTLPYGVDISYANSLREARSYWESKQNVFFKEVTSTKEADVLVRWVKEFGGRTLGHTVYSDFVEIGLGDSLCLGKWQPYKYDVVKEIATHELGHVLGYDDDYKNTNSVMYYASSTKYEKDLEETEFLPDGAYRFYPVCTKNSIGAYTITVTSTEPLDIYVIPSRADYELFSQGSTFTHYSNCEAGETRNYQRTCAVSQGGGVILRNPSVFGLGADARFTITLKEL